LFGNRRLMSAKGFAGSNPLRFLKQFEDYGLKGKLAVLPIGDIDKYDRRQVEAPPLGSRAEILFARVNRRSSVLGRRKDLFHE